MKKASLTLVFAIAATLAACSDNSVGPRGQVSESDMLVGGGVTTGLTSTDTVRFNIVIDPNSTSTFYLGAGNNLVFPAHSICDPLRTMYGDGQWDKPCAAAVSTVTEHVKGWLDSKGHPQVDFSPDLRFVPSAVPTQWVNIQFADFQASLDPTFNILYCQNIHAKCIDESKKDPTLLTVRNAVTGKVTRRIKHFSGYMVGAGDDSAPPPSMAHAPATTTLVAAVDTVRLAFTIDPSRTTTYTLASGHTVLFPARSVCDPATSSYGPSEWDAPCSPSASPVKVTAKLWRDASGPHLDFMPHLRFVPSSSPGNWVTVNFVDASASLSALSKIHYCPDVATCYDDAATDPTLTTSRNSTLGTVSRRIKHFSGYMLASGRQ